MNNPFEAVADNQLTAHAKAQHRATAKRMEKLVVQSERDAPMVVGAVEKAAFERSQQLKNYHRHLATQRAALLAGKYGSEIHELLRVLDSLTLSSAPALMTFMAKCAWFQHCDRGTRLEVLALISTSIARMRIRGGLPPFDDSLPGEDPTAYEVVRTNLQVLS